MEELISDWRFIVFCCGMLLAVGEARYKLVRHERILDKSGQSNIERATMKAEISEMGRDISEIRSSLDRLNEKYDAGTARLWTDLEASKERVAKLEGRMNGAI